MRNFPKSIGKGSKKRSIKRIFLKKLRKIPNFFEIFQKKENKILKILPGKANIPTVALRGALTAPRFTCFYHIVEMSLLVNSNLRLQKFQKKGNKILDTCYHTLNMVTKCISTTIKIFFFQIMLIYV